jgi:5'-methylthioinosine phosphorylase
MGRLALVGGSSIRGAEFPPGARRREVATPWGDVAVLEAAGFAYLQRHGLDVYEAPHAIDPKANMHALAELDCDRVLALGSVGALRPELEVGTFLCPDDFIALHLGTTYSDAEGGHRVPGLDPGWRARVLGASGGAGLAVRDGGVYWQAIGPRFETPAEIRLIAAHADVIGMTLASEWILAGELGLAYTAICVVDNLANGVGEAPLTQREYEAGRAANRDRLLSALEEVLPVLAEAGE